MSEDLLERATAALREETAAPDLRAGLTRARVLESAAKAKRGWRLRWLVPFVLTFGASTALAHVTQQYFPAVWNAIVPAAFERHEPAREEQAALARAKRKPRSTPVAAAPVEMPAPAPAPVAAVVPAERSAPLTPGVASTAVPADRKAAPATRRGLVSPRPSRASAPAPAPAPAPALAPAPAPAPTLAVESAELALFRRAMKLHDARDPAAIRAWDDFLRVAPQSPLATEARYVRALGLVRAGRSAEARGALAPFARGDFGGYRQREAAELLDALR